MRYVDLMGGHEAAPARQVGQQPRRRDARPLRAVDAVLPGGQARRAGRGSPGCPFPVHVVERVETYDRISGNRFVTRYAYHHGYFDGVEREFRGFGMVEQWDTEEFAALNAERRAARPATNIDAASHVPPVLTKTWFHTGVYLGRDHVSDFFAGLLDGNDAGEYYREPGLTDAQARALLLDDTVLPDGLTVDEEREACRALKGSMLRQEVYALDGTAERAASLHGHRAELHDPSAAAARPATATPSSSPMRARRSATTTSATRPIPRIGHALTLEVDDFGNVLQVRRDRLRAPAAGPGPVAARTRRKQSADAHHLHRERRSPTPIDDRRRLPHAAALRVAHLRADRARACRPGADRFALRRRCLAAGHGARPPIALRAGPDRRRAAEAPDRARAHALPPRRPRRGAACRSASWSRWRCRARATSSPSRPGCVDASVYGGRVDRRDARGPTAATCTAKATPNWWIPSGRVFYSPDAGRHAGRRSSPTRAQHFFLPHRYRDPFHTNAVSTESFVTYDAYDLLVQETRDALGNRVTVGERDVDPAQPLVRRGHDYRVLQPALVMDPNRNRSEVAFDALGMVVGTAVMGKPEEAPVPATRSTRRSRRSDRRPRSTQFLADPDGPIRGHAARRRHHAHRLRPRPPTGASRDPAKPQPAVRRHARARDARQRARAGGQACGSRHSFSYSDGFGREIQKKIQAEPGPVPSATPTARSSSARTASR